MHRRAFLLLPLLFTAPASASSPEEAKKRDKPKDKPQPPPEPKKDRPRKGDGVAPTVPDTRPELPGGKFYRYPRSL